MPSATEMRAVSTEKAWEFYQDEICDIFKKIEESANKGFFDLYMYSDTALLSPVLNYLEHLGFRIYQATITERQEDQIQITIRWD